LVRNASRRVPFALHQFLGQGDKRPSEPSET